MMGTRDVMPLTTPEVEVMAKATRIPGKIFIKLTDFPPSSYPARAEGLRTGLNIVRSDLRAVEW